MCIELHKPSAASMRELIELERGHGEQFVPSQFERGSPSDNVNAGFELAKQRVINYLIERAEWLRREWHNGGNFEYLRAKEDDCRYIAKVVKEMQP